MDVNANLSCEGFPTDSSTSSKSAIHYPCGGAGGDGKAKDLIEKELSCSNMFSTSSSTSSTITSALFQQECRLTQIDRKEPPNIGYEFSIAKSIMQQYSTLSGDNLFDHLSDIIKRVIDERPPNVIDFFEEFSRNVREQKLHLPERFAPDAVFEETRMFRVARRMLTSMKLPYPEDLDNAILDEGVSEDKSSNLDEFKLDLESPERLFITFNDRVQQLQFYWNQCGFSICSDDIFQLACSMDRLQMHPSILQCRFWGMMNGLRASYYVVEATLTRQEINQRLDQMEEELQSKARQLLSKMKNRPLPSYIGPELTPGAVGWEKYDPEELAKMTPEVEKIPIPDIEEVFDIPPEPVGTGLNRNTYFVVNALSDEWIELPIVTPKQIAVSRQIKKFLTGDLESSIASYPCFPGKEKHYLRALIARITAGTYIAPDRYYRKMTKREQRLYNGIEDDEMEEEEEEEEIGMGEGEDEAIENDILLLRNEKYEPEPLNTMAAPINWVHVRPAILRQGRIVWFDEELARREREKELARLLKLQMAEEMGIEEEENEEEEEEEIEEEGLLDTLDRREIGPAILTSCDNDDASEEFTVPWIARYTSRFSNKIERVLVMHSNLWPGAYTFTFEKVCESIYMGWGHKYNSRNMPFVHLPMVVEEYPHDEEDFIEATDPSVEEEEAYRQWLLNKLKKPEMDDVDEQIEEYDNDDDGLESGSHAD